MTENTPTLPDALLCQHCKKRHADFCVRYSWEPLTREARALAESIGTDRFRMALCIPCMRSFYDAVGEPAPSITLADLSEDPS